MIPFELPILGEHGATLKSDDVVGKAVWINFFASWCGDCNVEMPDLLSTYAKYKAEGLTVVGVNVGEPDFRAWAFRERFKIPYPILMDRNSAVFDRYVATGHIPTNLFYNSARNITCVSLEGLTHENMEQEVTIALQE